MNNSPRTALVALGAARHLTRADQEKGVPELIPTSLWQVAGWSR